MKIVSILVVASALGLAALGSTQSLKERLKVPDARLPHPSHDLYKVHGRRLAVNTKRGRHQPRLLGKKNRHGARQDVRDVAHHVTKPHKHG